MGNYIDDNKEKIQYTPGGTLCQVFWANENANCSISLVTMNAICDYKFVAFTPKEIREYEKYKRK